MKTIIVTIALLISSIIFSQETVINPQKKQKIEALINHFESNDRLMGTISIFENGKEVINKTFGEKNKTSNSLEERTYTIGSITKLFVAVLFAKLKEDNKISFKEKLANYFPTIPNANKIEIRQMLNHTSGLRSYNVKADTLYFWLRKPRTEKEIMSEIINQGVLFQPGDTMSYSNSAYYLLGRILEEKYKKPFKQIIETEIAKPLHLKNTFYIAEDDKHNNIAKSYEKKNGEWIEMEEFYFPNVFSAGGIASTAFDMNIFLNALFTNKIIKEETLKEMLPKGNNWFGLGVMKAPFYEHKGYGHGGDTFGTHSVASYNPTDKISFTYSINGEDYPNNKFAIGFLSIIYDKEYELPNFSTEEYIPEERYFELYEGTYKSPEAPIAIKIYKEDGKLKVQGEGQSPFTVTPIRRHVFEHKDFALTITFKPEESALILEQSKQVFEMKKQ